MNVKLIGIALAAAAGLAQSPDAARPSRPEFEVAAIKQNKSGSLAGYNHKLPGGRVNVTNVPVRSLIMNAYDLMPSRIEGGPSWLTSDRYDIEAKAEGNATPAEMKLMLQSLLADRFRLKFHYEAKEMSIYALVERKPGVRNPAGLVESKEGGCSPFAADGPSHVPVRDGVWGDTPCGNVNFLISARGATLHAQGASLSQLANTLSAAVDPASCALQESGCRPVVDKTGIEGVFDIDMQWTPDPMPGRAPNPESTGPSIFTAIQEQLGLKLEPQKGPVDILVIDHVERPSEN